MITYSTNAAGTDFRREPTMTRQQLEAIGRRIFQHEEVEPVPYQSHQKGAGHDD